MGGNAGGDERFGNEGVWVEAKKINAVLKE